MDDIVVRRQRALETMARVQEAFRGVEVDVDAAIRELRGEDPEPEDATHATVILFKPSGKYYTEEKWLIPENAVVPYDMIRSPDARSIGGGKVLVPSQEPWGYPHLISPSPGVEPSP